MNSQEAIDKLVLMLVSGVSPEAAERAAVEKLGVAAKSAKKLLRQAQQAITRAADFNRQDEVGTAYLRLTDLYTRAIKTGDVKTALAAQRELNRLLALYTPPADEPDDTTTTGDAAHELDLIRGHLLPLALAPDTYPLHEHARIAADLVRQSRSG